MSQSAVSRQVSALERELKVTLFHRHARGLVLTEQGELLHSTVSEVMTKLQTAEMLLADTSSKPCGSLCVASPVGLGSVWVTQRLREFLDLYPDIQIELVLNDDQIDIAMREADVAIWTSEPEHPDLIRRPLFTSQVRPMASTKYARRFGTPDSLDELDAHRIISYSGPADQLVSAIRWLELAGRDEREPRTTAFKANTVVAIRYAILSGLGIGMIPDYMIENEADLVPVLKQNEDDYPELSVYFAYPEELKGSKKVGVLRDFLVAKARNWKG